MNKICVIFLLHCCLALPAQTPVFRLQEMKELGNVRMTTMLQDSRGWLWFGAEEGLYRYDGLTFHSVGLPDSLQHQAVSALYEWDGRIWAGFRNGAIGYLPAGSAFSPGASDERNGQKQYAAFLQRWQPEEGLPVAAITAFAADSSGGFWIATYGEGLYCLKNNRLYQFSTADDGLGSDEIYTLAGDAQGNIWAATDAGVSICSMRTPGHKQVRRLTTAEGLTDEIITALSPDRQGNMWIGTHENGLCRYNSARRQFDLQTKQWRYGTVTGLATFGSSELWVGTENQGPVRFEPASGVATPLPDGHPLRGLKMRTLSKDREGLLWLICDKGEIYTANVRFGMLAAPPAGAQTVLVDGRNRLWAGNAEGLFVRENGAMRPVLPRKDNIIALWESPVDGNIWAGTFGNGLYIVSAAGKVLRHVAEGKGLANGNILSIAGDRHRVWLATLGGVTSADLSGQQFEVRPELGSSFVYKVFVDSRSRVWFGTDGKGLSVLEGGIFRHFAEANGAALKTIYSITEDRNGHIWFSTDNSGLFRYDGGQFRRYTTDNHLHSLAITGLSTDGNGQIIVAYEDGVDILNPDRTDHVTFCDASIGAPPVEVNLNALCRDGQGNVWLGSRHGILRMAAFDETFLDDPQPGITAVSVFSSAIDFLSQTVFPHDQNYFIFNFTGLWYSDPESVRYRYRLEGFDPDWKVSKDHLASYPNLPPGHYRFRVQTSEHGNFDSVPEANWSFVIRQPVWMRWWFVSLCLAAIAGLFYLYITNREARLQRVSQLQREMVESQFAALKSQINPHFLFNSFNTLITIIEENPRIAVEYVEHLSDFYRSIIAYREKDFISLREEMDLVHSFDFLLKKRYEDGFSLQDRLNGHGGQIMPLALQMLVENAVKHNIISSTKPLTVEIFAENDGYVVVRNNVQPKIKPEPSTHFGLQSLVNRYQLLGERPVIVEENGAFFTVKVPVKEVEG